jgi:hypothetical protein
MTEIFVPIVIAVFSGVVVFLTTKAASKNEQLSELKNQALMLFLYAEKKDWVNEEKMKWCVNTIYLKLPDLIKKVLKEESLELWMQDQYDNFKGWLKEQSVIN